VLKFSTSLRSSIDNRGQLCSLQVILYLFDTFFIFLAFDIFNGFVLVLAETVFGAFDGVREGFDVVVDMVGVVLLVYLINETTDIDSILKRLSPTHRTRYGLLLLLT